MQIGFDISAQSLPRSGVGRYQYQLLKALLKLDHQNFYHLYGFNFRNRKRFEDICFDATNYEIRISPIPQKLITFWWLMSRWPSLERVFEECDVIQISELCIQPVANAKTVAFVHDLTTLLFPEYHTAGNRFLHQERFKRLDRADAILTNSEATKRDIVKHLDINSAKVHVTHLGADESFRPIDPKKVRVFLDKHHLSKPYILFVGTLEPRKNVKTLLKAFENLKEHYNIPHQLVLAGQKGWLYEELFRKIESSPNKKDIVHLDYMPDEALPYLMNGATVFVYPSIYEGFGLPVLEAMQCGTPVITSNVSSLPEVGGDACLYTASEDTVMLGNRIYDVIHDHAEREKLSKMGLLQAKRFSWEKCAKETLAVYKQLKN